MLLGLGRESLAMSEGTKEQQIPKSSVEIHIFASAVCGQLGFSWVLKPTHGLERGSLPDLNKRKGSQASQGSLGLERGESSKANF